MEWLQWWYDIEHERQMAYLFLVALIVIMAMIVYFFSEHHRERVMQNEANKHRRRAIDQLVVSKFAEGLGELKRLNRIGEAEYLREVKKLSRSGYNLNKIEGIEKPLYLPEIPNQRRTKHMVLTRLLALGPVMREKVIDIMVRRRKKPQSRLEELKSKLRTPNNNAS